MVDRLFVIVGAGASHKIRGLSRPQGGFTHGELHYPVLSVPVGEADELVCPDEHLDFLKEKLAATQPLRLLLVGYSGNDREVLSLVRGIAPALRIAVTPATPPPDAERATCRAGTR